ncbi:MAG: SURF1 family protein [Pseudomonadota bacterium]
MPFFSRITTVGKRLSARPVQLLAVLVSTAILVSLGQWQLHRLEWKRDLIAKAEARASSEPGAFALALQNWQNGIDQEYVPVALEGVFRHDLEAHLFGSYDGMPGYYVFTPLEATIVAQGIPPYVYVNRGFVPQAVKDAERRKDSMIDGTVSLAGLFRAPEQAAGIAGFLKPPNDIDANVWHARRPNDFAASAGIEAAPVYVDSFGEENPSQWPKGGVTRLEFSNRHFEYALTWFGLAGALWTVFLAAAYAKKP